MASHTVQQFFADYFKAMLIKGSYDSYVNSLDACYSDTSLPRFAYSNKSCPQQQLLNMAKSNNVGQYDLAYINGIIIENNYLRNCLQKAETMKLCDILEIQTNSTQSLNGTVTTQCTTSTHSSTGDGEVGLKEHEIPNGFLHDFLYLMEATKHLPIRTQNIIILHFASEHRERMNQSSTELK